MGHITKFEVFGDTFGPRGDAVMYIYYTFDMPLSVMRMIQDIRWSVNKCDGQPKKEGLTLIAGWDNDQNPFAEYAPRFKYNPSELKLLTVDEIVDKITAFMKEYEDLQCPATVLADAEERIKKHFSDVRFHPVWMKEQNQFSFNDWEVTFQLNVHSPSKYVNVDMVNNSTSAYYESIELQERMTLDDLKNLPEEKLAQIELEAARMMNEHIAYHLGNELLRSKMDNAHGLTYSISNLPDDVYFKGTFRVTNLYNTQQFEEYSFSDGNNLFMIAQSFDMELAKIKEKFEIAKHDMESQKSNEIAKHEASVNRKTDKILRENLSIQWADMKAYVELRKP